MGAFGIYLIKASVCLILFYLFFKVLMSRDTFFRFNRFVLLVGVLFCVLLPFLQIEMKGAPTYVQERFWQLEVVLRQDEVVAPEFAEDSVGILSVMPVVEERVKEAETGGWAMIRFAGLYFAGGVYGMGCLVLLAGLVIAYRKMIKTIRAGRKIKYPDYTLVLSGQTICPFNWGKYIVMSETDYNNNCPEVLAHEKSHLRKRHTIDLVFMELYVVFFWFNPAVWLLKKELQEIHEYEADSGVLNQGIDATKYQLLLVKKAVGARLYSIANSFNHSKLKNRITMMLKEKSNRKGQLKALLFILPAALLMFAFAHPAETLSATTVVVSSKTASVVADPPEIMQDSLKKELQPNSDTKIFFSISKEKKPEEAANVKKKGNITIAFSRPGQKITYSIASKAMLKTVLDTINSNAPYEVNIYIQDSFQDKEATKDLVNKIKAERGLNHVHVHILSGEAYFGYRSKNTSH